MPVPKPNPETATVSGLVAALLVIRIFPKALPIAEGVNRNVSAIDCPGGRVFAVGLAEKIPFEDVILAIFKVSLPELVIDIVVSFHCPICKEVNAMLDLLSARTGEPIP